MFFTYILKSSKTNKYYYGHTHNLEQRLIVHNRKKVRFTKAFVPWTVHYFESFETKSEAYKRELFFKSIDGYVFLKNKNII